MTRQVLIAALAATVLLGGPAAASGVDPTLDARAKWVCAGVDKVVGVCVDSPYGMLPDGTVWDVLLLP